ncbi:MAG: hypothetical protein ACPGJS_01830 [Flammeovirgaceae bacterium]
MKISKNYNSFLRITLFQQCVGLCLFFSVFFNHFTIQGQRVQLERQIPSNGIYRLSMDRYQHIYGISNTGAVVKLDSLGNQLAIYSPPQNNDISLIEAWQAVKVFLFYEETQSFTLCDRFLGNCMSYNFPETMGYVSMATLAADGSIWLFDQDDFAIKKYNIRTQQITLENPINLLIDEPEFAVQYMREYQNQLFILSEEHLYQFDLFGNLNTTKNRSVSSNWIGFLGNELYYLDQNQLFCHALYQANTQTIQFAQAYTQVLWLNPTLFIGIHSEQKRLDWLRLLQIKD